MEIIDKIYKLQKIINISNSKTYQEMFLEKNGLILIYVLASVNLFYGMNQMNLQFFKKC